MLQTRITSQSKLKVNKHSEGSGKEMMMVVMTRTAKLYLDPTDRECK